MNDRDEKVRQLAGITAEYSDKPSDSAFLLARKFSFEITLEE